MKIFIGLMEIAGYYSNLKRGFQELGIEATFVDLEQHKFGYGGDDQSNMLVRLTLFFSSRRSKTPRKKILQKAFLKSIEAFFKILLFMWAVTRYDVFIISGDVSFIFFYDLPIMKWMKKKVIYIFNGSEARPPYIDGAVMGDKRGRGINDCIRLAQRRKKVLKKIEKYADIIISHPCYGHFHEKVFIHFNRIGFPFALPTIELPNSTENRDLIRILHSPSDPEGKGSAYFRKAIANLKMRGYSIDYVEITQKPHQEVLQELAQCDFVLDQVFSDLFLSAFGTEASFYGKPVVVSGYCLDEVSQQLPIHLIPPVQYCLPHQIESRIEQLIVDIDYRLQLGQKAKHFIQQHWSPVTVAEQYVMLINSQIQPEWLCDPMSIRYLHGYGFPEHKVKRLIKQIIEAGGEEALQLSDKPELKQLLHEFSSQINSNEMQLSHTNV